MTPLQELVASLHRGVLLVQDDTTRVPVLIWRGRTAVLNPTQFMADPIGYLTLEVKKLCD